MSIITISNTVAIIRQAIANLGEWDWNQDFVDPATDERHIISGADEIDSLPKGAQPAAREYAEWCVEQFAEAREYAERAIDELELYYPDLEAAAWHIDAAAGAERAMGEANEMRACVEAVEALAEHIDYAADMVRAVEDADWPEGANALMGMDIWGNSCDARAYGSHYTYIYALRYAVSGEDDAMAILAAGGVPDDVVDEVIQS